MKSKFINWNNKINKYVNKQNIAVMNPQIGLGDVGYFDYYLNFLSDNRIKYSQGLESLASNPYFNFEGIKSYNRQYTDDPIDAGALTNLGNLLNPAVTKTLKCPSVAISSVQHSGFRMQINTNSITNSFKRQFDSIVIQLNKLDKTLMDKLDNFVFVFEYIAKQSDSNSQTSTNSTIYRIEWRPDVYSNSTVGMTESITISGNTTTANGIKTRKALHNFKNGIFLIDGELLKQFGATALQYAGPCGGDANCGGWSNSGSNMSYHFNFYIQALNSSVTATDLEISNITFTNAFSAYLDSEIKFEENNLSKFNQSDKTGVVFLDLNEYNKNISSKISLMTLLEVTPFKMMIHKNNMNSPFYFFPYCESNSNLTASQSLTDTTALYTSGLNTETGGLYRWDTKFNIDNYDSNDFYDLEIKLNEYK